jgi:hypothetical protein
MMQMHHDEGRIDIAFPPERVPELIEVTARLNPDVSDFLAWQSFSAMRLKAIRGRDEALFDVSRRYSEATIITGRLVFRRGAWFERPLHNETSRLIPQRLQWRCVLMEILPVRVPV